MEASELKRIKTLEVEKVKLKGLFADMALENTALKDLIEKREAIGYLIDTHGLYMQWACRSVGPSRSA